MKDKHEVGTDKGILDVVITQEKIDGKTFFVAQGIQVEVASQGLTLEEALENIKDAVEMVVENSKDVEINTQISKERTAPILTRVFF